ncbi:MAG: hypothetical protein HZA01_14090 [Nitrospinae bacterium]|nr:hypothetical protein [Nitrospinota bacterium]
MCLSSIGLWAGLALPPGAAKASEITAIAAGSYHSLAVKQDGTVWAWGDNSRGQLGDGSTENKSSPVQVVMFSAPTNVKASASVGSVEVSWTPPTMGTTSEYKIYRARGKDETSNYSLVQFGVTGEGLMAEDGINSQRFYSNSQLPDGHRSLVNGQLSKSKESYLEIPIYLSALNDVNSAQFDVAYPSDSLAPDSFVLDKKLKKYFDAKTEFRQKGLAVVSIAYKQKGRAAIGSTRALVGTLRFKVPASGTAGGEIGFSRIHLYDRFGRDFVRSDLKMKVEAKGVKFSVKGNGKALAAQAASSATGTLTFSPKQGKVGDEVMIYGDFGGK